MVFKQCSLVRRLCLSVMIAVLAPLVGCADASVEKPNFIVIVADDLGYGDLGVYGNKNVNTPNIDRLAKEGILFTDFHSNGAVCSPTRAALLMGNYQQRSGVTGVITAKSHRDFGLSTEQKTFAEALKEAGYATGMFGKWHLGYQPEFNPVNQGFDEFIGFVSGNIDYHSHVDQEGHADWWFGQKLKKDKGYVTDLISQYSVDFVRRHQDKNFLLYIPHEAPHYPIQDRNSKPDRVPGERPAKSLVKGSEPTHEVYANMIEIMDESIGDLVKTLKELELDKKTIILFLSDNGGANLARKLPLRG